MPEVYNFGEIFLGRRSEQRGTPRPPAPGSAAREPGGVHMRSAGSARAGTCPALRRGVCVQP